MYGTKRVMWQKKNGDIIQRNVQWNDYKIGDVNSYGWIVVDVKYYYKNNFYSFDKYEQLVNKEIKRDRQIMLIKKNINKTYKQLIYLVELLIVIRYLEVFSNMVV